MTVHFTQLIEFRYNRSRDGRFIGLNDSNIIIYCNINDNNIIYIRVRDKVHCRFAAPHAVIPSTDVNLKT